MRNPFFVFLFLFVCCFHTLSAQGIFQNLFGKEKIQNLANFDKQRWSYGYYLGFNSYDFKFDYKTLEGQPNDIIVQRNIGFNVGLVGNLRINDYFDLRLEPGVMFTTRNLTFPEFADRSDSFREVKSTYVHIPLLLKISTKRLNNFKPFLIGGVSTSWNLSSNQDNPDDNSRGQFRMKDNTYYWEIGFGIDFYLYYFKFTPSIRGVFAINDELVRDADPNSPYTSNIGAMYSRGIFINFTFQ
jgi:hypothetical protein